MKLIDNKRSYTPDVDIDDANILVLDTETNDGVKTGYDKSGYPLEPEEGVELSEVIEVCFRLIQPNKEDIVDTFLVKPNNPITSNVMAVHHITNEDVEDALAYEPVMKRFFAPIMRDSKGEFTSVEEFGFDVSPVSIAIREILERGESIVPAAHNMVFDMAMLKPVEHTMDDGSTKEASLRGLSSICSLRAAKHLFPDVPSCSNQALRYELPLGLPRDLDPHRAEDDTLVSAAILKYEIEKFKELGVGTKLKDFIDYIDSPYVMEYMPFGKYRAEGKPADLTIKEIALQDSSYLHWVLNNTDPDMDMEWNIRKGLEFASAGNRPRR